MMLNSEGNGYIQHQVAQFHIKVLSGSKDMFSYQTKMCYMQGWNDSKDS